MTPQPKRPFETQPQYRTSIPNSVFENQFAVSNAELRLQLIVMGRPNLPLSDETWKKFTGLDPRMKEMATKGLREKGVLQVTGKGKHAKYVFDTQAWESYWRTQTRSEKARTVGRAPTVKAKPGMMVHEACADKCQKLCEPDKPCEVISISSGQQIAKPISRNPPDSTPEIAKPISQNSSQVVDSIETDLGNQIPVEHLESVNTALLRSRPKIDAATSPKAYEASIITATIKKSVPTKTKQPKPRGGRTAEVAKVDAIHMAQMVLQKPDEYSEQEIRIAREIVNGSSQ